MRLIIESSALKHYGVLGMKWGIRRYQNADGSLTEAGKKRYGVKSNKQATNISNKEFKSERDKLYYKHLNNSDKNKQINQLKSEANKLYKKYDFDADDGGGGTSEASRQAGEQYIKIWDQINKLENDRHTDATVNATNDLIKKYGKEKYNELKKRQSRIDAAKAFGVASGILGISFATLVGIGVAKG